MKALISILFISMNTLLFSQEYSLPVLPYSYASYEPYIDAQTMEIHHSKHHQAYVTNLNKALAGTKLATLSMNQLLMDASFRTDIIRNNAGGHFNHSLFWEVLAPKDKQTSIIQESFDSAIKTQYGSMDSLKKALTQAASTRFGSGWAWLIVTPDKKLMVTSTGNQDNPIMDVAKDRGIPVLGIDVWEHAYYLKYQNKRADYLGGIFNLIDWGIVSDKYSKALVDPLLSEIEKDNWMALKDFHKVMAQTYHPAEEGNFVPLRTRSGELLAKAILFANSKPPLSKDKPEVHKALTNLAEQCDKIYELTAKNAKEDVLMKEITKAHDLFHQVEELCHD
jgi:superoxide dismutase